MKDFLERDINVGDSIVYSYTTGSSLSAKLAIVEGFERRKKNGRFKEVLVVREVIDSTEYNGVLSRIEDSTRVVKVDSSDIPLGKWQNYKKLKDKIKYPKRDPKDKSTWKRCQYCHEPMNPIYDPDDIYTSDNCGR